jgi:energy-coupling factor transport system permease protein
VQGGLAHAVTARIARSATESIQESTRPPVLAPASTPAPAPVPARKRRPRSEMLAPILLGAMVGSLVAGRLEMGALCLLVAWIAGVLAGARPPSRAWLGLLAWGALFSIALNLYLNPGEPLPLPTIFGRHATREGLMNGVLLVMRTTGATLAVFGLMALWPGERAADEIAGLLAPLERLRVPVRRARAVLSLALRFAPLVTDEFRRVAQVQALRAGRPPRGGREWVQRQRATIVPAVIGSLERADRVALALEARHYRLRPVSRGPKSPWIVSGAGFALAVVALVWRA